MIRFALALCLGVTACSAPQNPKAAATTAAAPHSAELTAALVPAGSPVATKPQQEQVGLRPSYAACVEQAEAVIPATQACVENEVTYQQARLDRALASAKSAQPNQAAAIQYQQDAWQSDTDAKCAWDASSEGQQQRIEANMCSLRAIASRADELSR